MTRDYDELPPEEAHLIGLRPPTQEDADREAAQKRDRDLRDRAIVLIMQNEHFRAWLMQILDELGTYDNPFGASPNGFPDAQATLFLLGKKAAGLVIHHKLDDLAPELVSLMRRERRGTV